MKFTAITVGVGGTEGDVESLYALGEDGNIYCKVARRTSERGQPAIYVEYWEPLCFPIGDPTPGAESSMTINGMTIESGLAMTIRVAMENFAMDLKSNEEVGDIGKAYMKRIREFRLLSQHIQPSADCPEQIGDHTLVEKLLGPLTQLEKSRMERDDTPIGFAENVLERRLEDYDAAHKGEPEYIGNYIRITDVLEAGGNLSSLVEKAQDILRKQIVPDGMSDHDALSELHGIFDCGEQRSAQQMWKIVCAQAAAKRPEPEHKLSNFMGITGQESK